MLGRGEDERGRRVGFKAAADAAHTLVAIAARLRGFTVVSSSPSHLLHRRAAVLAGAPTPCYYLLRHRLGTFPLPPPRSPPHHHRPQIHGHRASPAGFVLPRHARRLAPVRPDAPPWPTTAMPDAPTLLATATTCFRSELLDAATHRGRGAPPLLTFCYCLLPSALPLPSSSSSEIPRCRPSSCGSSHRRPSRNQIEQPASSTHSSTPARWGSSINLGGTSKGPGQPLRPLGRNRGRPRRRRSVASARRPVQKPPPWKKASTGSRSSPCERRRGLYKRTPRSPPAS